jgi:hypothetical protein
MKISYSYKKLFEIVQPSWKDNLQSAKAYHKTHNLHFSHLEYNQTIYLSVS